MSRITYLKVQAVFSLRNSPRDDITGDTHICTWNCRYRLSSIYMYLHLHLHARGRWCLRWGLRPRVTAAPRRREIVARVFLSSAFSPRPPFFPQLPVTIKDRSHVAASRLSIVRRSSRVSRFSHKTRGTTFDRRQSAIIIRVPGDLRLGRRGPDRSSRSR